MVATLIVNNISKHIFILGIYIDTILTFIDKGHKLLSNTFKALVQTRLIFITKIKEDFNRQTVLDTIQKVVNISF